MYKDTRLEEYKISVTEVIDILNYLPEKMTCKIPKKFWEFLQKNSIEEYKPNFDYSQGLDNINLNNKTKKLLAMIYRNYMCTEEEKIEYDKILLKNEEKYQKELKKKYNADNLFKKEKVENNIVTNENEELQLIVIKDNIFTKLINMVKKLIRK